MVIALQAMLYVACLATIMTVLPSAHVRAQAGIELADYLPAQPDSSTGISFASNLAPVCNGKQASCSSHRMLSDCVVNWHPTCH